MYFRKDCWRNEFMKSARLCPYMRTYIAIEDFLRHISLSLSGSSENKHRCIIIVRCEEWKGVGEASLTRVALRIAFHARLVPQVSTCATNICSGTWRHYGQTMPMLYSSPAALSLSELLLKNSLVLFLFVTMLWYVGQNIFSAIWYSLNA